MGLGLHGGGAASVRFLAENGAVVTATDLRSPEVLKPSIEALSDLNVKYVLGRHEIDDFRNADIVIKNPAVKNDSPYLLAAREAGTAVETDISIFLQLNKRPVIAVTGSKGKSTTVSAVCHVMKQLEPATDLGGNITVSPLTFFNDKKNSSGAPVILELSSWQLADLAGRELLKPEAVAVTNIMHDHQDRYHSMDDYAADKAVIFESQDSFKPLILNKDSEYTEKFSYEASSMVYYLHPAPSAEKSWNENGAWINEKGEGFWLEKGRKTQLLNSELTVKGYHNRVNLLTAAALLFKYGVPSDIIRSALASFPGIAHRLEYIRDIAGISWYNDSAATIPEAAAAAIDSFDGRVHLLTGGTDKELDFSPLAEKIASAGNNGILASVSLLEGSGTDKLIKALNSENITFDGPYKNLASAVENIRNRAASISGVQYAVLSPGCSSFGMFKNEFDRGNQFRELIKSL